MWPNWAKPIKIVYLIPSFDLLIIRPAELYDARAQSKRLAV